MRVINWPIGRSASLWVDEEKQCYVRSKLNRLTVDCLRQVRVLLAGIWERTFLIPSSVFKYSCLSMGQFCAITLGLRIIITHGSICAHLPSPLICTVVIFSFIYFNHVCNTTEKSSHFLVLFDKYRNDTTHTNYPIFSPECDSWKTGNLRTLFLLKNWPACSNYRPVRLWW